MDAPKLTEEPAEKPIDTSEANIKRLIGAINENPDELHANSTPAVHDLTDIGPKAIPFLVELQLSGDESTRHRAMTALEWITLKMYGWRPGHGWKKNANREKEWDRLWLRLGSPSWEDPEEERKNDVKLWREWIAKGYPIDP